MLETTRLPFFALQHALFKDTLESSIVPEYARTGQPPASPRGGVRKDSR